MDHRVDVTTTTTAYLSQFLVHWQSGPTLAPSDALLRMLAWLGFAAHYTSAIGVLIVLIAWAAADWIPRGKL